MKTYQEIERNMREKRARINDLEAMIGGAKWSERTGPEIVAASNEAELLKIENKILKDNARRAYFAEVIPVVVEEFQKFKGKQYGDKTKEKISDACKARAGCAAYIHYQYSTAELCIVPLDKNGYSGTGMFGYKDLDVRMKNWTVGGDGQKLLDNNRIQEFSADDLTICDCGEYEEDVRARAELIKIQFSEVKKAWDQYNAACSAYNRLVPSGMEGMNAYSAPRGYIL